MNDKLKGLLGEELSKQVEEKLGSIELGIANDGSLVPAEKFDTIKTERNKAQADVETLTAQVDGNAKIVEELTQKAGMSDELKTTIESMKTTMETTKATVLSEAAEKEANIIKTYAIKEHLAKANANPDAIGYLVNDFDLSQVEMDGDNIKNWEALLEPLKSNKKTLFGESKFVGNTTHNGSGTPDSNAYAARYKNAKNNLEKVKIKREAQENGVMLN